MTLKLDPASISEDGGSSLVTATPSGATSEDVTLTVSATAVSPASASDFALSTNKVLTIVICQRQIEGVVDRSRPDRARRVGRRARGRW